MKLLFVCTGNTCRSSMAEVLAKEAAQLHGLTGWSFSSAGIAALTGSPASPNALKVMAERGLNLAEHRASLLNQDLLGDADLILTMTVAHRERICTAFPKTADKVFTLLEFAYGKPGDIVDPYGGDLETYRRSADEIKGAVEAVIKRLQKRI